MKISSIGKGFISAALLYAQAAAVETDYSAGTRALPLRQSAGTARATAMGSAVVGVSQGSASLLWNPAGLSRMSCQEIGLHHNTGLSSIIQEIAIFGTPLGEVEPGGQGGSLGGIAASLGYVNYGSFDGRDALGVQTGFYHPRGYSGSLGWGKELLPGFAGGIAVKANRSNFAEETYNTYGADLGLLWAVAPSLDLGLAYSNFSFGDKLAENRLVSGWRLGAGWTVNDHWLLAASGEIQDKAMDRLQFGTEYLIGNTEGKSNILALRAGYQIHYPDPQLGGLTGLTLGAGYTASRSMTFDYAILPTGDLGTSHRLSLTFKFNCPGEEKPTPEPVVILVPVEPAPVVVKAILLGDSFFDFDKSTLKPEGMKVLRENVQILEDNPKARVRVSGYTSMMGTPEYNQALSERRASAVEKFLVEEGGIAPGRITTIGYGETRPATVESRPGKIRSRAAKSNMRVLFEVTVK